MSYSLKIVDAIDVGSDKLSEITMFCIERDTKEHMLYKYYHIEKLTLSYLSKYGFDFDQNGRNLSENKKMYLTVKYADVVPFETVHVDLSHAVKSYYNVGESLGSVLTKVLPEVVQKRMLDFTPEEKGKYLPALMHVPYAYVHSTYVEDKAMYLEFGVSGSFKALQLSWNGKMISSICNTSFKAYKWKEMEDQLMKEVSLLSGDFELKYSYEYTSTDLLTRKVALVYKDNQWKSTNANNTAIKQLIQATNEFVCPTGYKMGDVWTEVYAMRGKTVYTVVGKNERCLLVNVDTFNEVKSKEKMCNVYHRTGSSFQIITLSENERKHLPYKGKYNNMIQFTGKVETPHLLTFEEVDILWEEETQMYTTDRPDQMVVEVQEQILTGDCVVDIAVLKNTYIDATSEEMYLVHTGSEVYVLSERDARVQKALKYQELAKKLME